MRAVYKINTQIVDLPIAQISTRSMAKKNKQLVSKFTVI